MQFDVQELALAESLADFVREQTAELKGERVAVLRVRIGAGCGIPPVALKTAFMSVVLGTSLQNCRLEVEEADLIVFCPRCHREQTLGDITKLVCPVCGTRTPRIVQGRELEIVSIDVVNAS